MLGRDGLGGGREILLPQSYEPLYYSYIYIILDLVILFIYAIHLL